jgi:Protein of unknown function (DUF3106)
MRMRFSVTAAFLAVCASMPVVSFAQVKASEGGNRPSTISQKKPPPAPRNPPKFAKQAPPNPVEELKRFQSLPPEQREKELAKLPPARRARVEKQLEHFDSLTPDERDRQFRRLELMNSLTPERKAMVQDEIQRIRALPARERREQLYGDDFDRKHSPAEQELIRGAFPKV